MSMKATQANIRFQQKVNKSNKQLETIDKKIDKLNNQLVNIVTAMKNIQPIKGLTPVSQKPNIEEDKLKKIDLDNNSPMFIPDIDTTDLTMNSSEEKKTVKDLDLDFGLSALEDIEEV